MKLRDLVKPRDVLFVAGGGLVVAGIAAVHWPSALIFAGGGLLLMARNMNAG